MKRAILYIIMLATTCATVYFTIVWEPVVENSIARVENKSESTGEEERKNNTANEKGNSNEDGNTYSENDEKVNMKNDEVINEKMKNDEESKQTVANVSLLKMDINDIADTISFVDKGKLVKMGYKLQNIDRKRIEEWVLESEGDIEGVRNAYNLLRSRLSSDDFNEFKEIIEPYVNIELLE